jgi:VIT1/CCC1 family predicted Fe2+/Mn2+ transporter
MALFGNRRVEEELERIRKANLPPEVIEAEEAKKREMKEAIQSGDMNITAKDVLAMIIAAFSIIIPYALIFIGIAALVLYLFVSRG